MCLCVCMCVCGGVGGGGIVAVCVSLRAEVSRRESLDSYECSHMKGTSIGGANMHRSGLNGNS